MPPVIQNPKFGWKGAWFGSWFGPSSILAPPGPAGTGTIITGGYGGSQIIVQGYGVALTSDTTFVGVGGISFSGVVMLGSRLATGTFLQALVTMLRANAALTGAIGGPRIFSTWPGPKTPLPFVIIEDYIESQPGETIEHNLNTVVISSYGPDKLTVLAVQTAVTNAVDSPAQNKFSTRVPLQWSTGTEESSWRQPTMPPMRTKIQMRGTDLWRWSIQYDFNILPNFQF